MEKKITTTVDELTEAFHKIKDSVVPTTPCKTITNTTLVRTRHGVIRVEKTSPIKY